MRKSEEQRVRNRSVKSALKTAVKRFYAATEAGDGEEARSSFEAASKALDKAASKGVIHKNKAANQKSRMARELGTLGRD